MSVKRALEFNFKARLDEVFEGTKYAVTESARLERRELPCIIINAQDSVAFEEHPDAQNNFDVQVEILVLSNIDETTIDEHLTAVDKCLDKMQEKSVRTQSRIKYLYLYGTYFVNTIEEYEERKIGTSITYKVHCNYGAYEA
jgi:hypothetical protein